MVNVSKIKILFLIFLLLSGIILYGAKLLRNYEPRFVFVGNTLISAKKLHSLVPKKDFTLWKNNESHVKAKLEEHSYVNEVNVVPCSRFSLWCYIVEITEEIPAFRILVNGSVSVFSKNDVMLWQGRESDIPPSIFKSLSLPVIEEESGRGGDVIFHSSYVRYINDVLRILQENDIQTLRIKVKNNKEQEILFNTLTFPIVFTFDQSNTDVLRQELTRLRSLVSSLGDDLPRVTSINLAYAKMGTVTFKDEERST